MIHIALHGSTALGQQLKCRFITGCAVGATAHLSGYGFFYAIRLSGTVVGMPVGALAVSSHVAHIAGISSQDIINLADCRLKVLHFPSQFICKEQYISGSKNHHVAAPLVIPGPHCDLKIISGNNSSKSVSLIKPP